MEPFSHHVFVCVQEKPEGVESCAARGSRRFLQALQEEIIAQGLDSQVQVTSCGCLGLCDHGPTALVYPEGIWYRGVKAEDAREIVSSHLRSGKPVARLDWNDARAMQAAIADHDARYRAAVEAHERAGTLPDDLNEMIRGFMASRAVLTALELDVFSAVGTAATAPEVAGKIHADARATEMLLNALTSLKLLQKRDGKFHNSAASSRFFLEGSPDNARPALLHTVDLWPRWSTLSECVRTGTAIETGRRDKRDTISFIAAMDRNSRERAPLVVQAVGQGVMARMLDLGGGSAAYSIAFARALPGLRSEILDVPEVVPLTRDYVRRAGLSDRITVRAGDMQSDPLGENYDLVLLSAICHMFSAEENRALFRRIREALAPGGRLVLQDFILEPDKTAPRIAALFSLNMLVGTRAGSSYSEPEYEDWLRGAGFAEVRRVRLPGPSGLMIGSRT